VTSVVDGRRYAPATVRNRQPIWSLLERELPASGLVLEVASGSGEHVVYFAREAGSRLRFQPSDPEPAARVSIDAWAAEVGTTNVLPAIVLDAAAETWPIQRADAVLCINMIHISPWSATEGLMRGAARLLPARGLLYVYGPFRRGGRDTSASNAAFDAELRAQNAQWGVRDLEAVTALAGRHGLDLVEVVQMPANNLSLIFRRGDVP
jgi:hypothetical protein